MTQRSYVAVPYTMAELSEPEEQHEIGEYIDYVGYDFRGFHGEVLLDGQWHTVWAFSEADSARFISEWGGILLDEETQKRVTGQRSREAEMLRELASGGGAEGRLPGSPDRLCHWQRPRIYPPVAGLAQR
jgi:hypothetical protein